MMYTNTLCRGSCLSTGRQGLEGGQGGRVFPWGAEARLTLARDGGVPRLFLSSWRSPREGLWRRG